MAFMKPDVLQKVMSERRSREATGALDSDTAFGKQVENLFGRKIIGGSRGKNIEKQNLDTVDVVPIK